MDGRNVIFQMALLTSPQPLPEILRPFAQLRLAAWRAGADGMKVLIAVGFDRASRRLPSGKCRLVTVLRIISLS